MIIKPRFFPTPAGNGGGFESQLVSLDFNGTDEFISDTVGNEQAVSIVNSWSVGYWWKPSNLTNLQSVLRIQQGTANQITTQLAGSLANDPLRIFTVSSSGNTIKDFRWNSLVSVDNWYLTIYTWDGTTQKLIHNGVDQGTPDTAFTDNAGTMTDTARIISVAADNGGAQPFGGRIHSVGIWSAVLSEAECLVLYNAGAGSTVDWANDSGAYINSSNLQHWYRLGFDSGDIGADYGNGALLTALNSGANITVDDIVADFPGA